MDRSVFSTSQATSSLTCCQRLGEFGSNTCHNSGRVCGSHDHGAKWSCCHNVRTCGPKPRHWISRIPLWSWIPQLERFVAGSKRAACKRLTRMSGARDMVVIIRMSRSDCTLRHHDRHKRRVGPTGHRCASCNQTVLPPHCLII